MTLSNYCQGKRTRTILVIFTQKNILSCSSLSIYSFKLKLEMRLTFRTIIKLHAIEGKIWQSNFELHNALEHNYKNIVQSHFNPTHVSIAWTHELTDVFRKL